jgi:hypothetical protein
VWYSTLHEANAPHFQQPSCKKCRGTFAAPLNSAVLCCAVLENLMFSASGSKSRAWKNSERFRWYILNDLDFDRSAMTDLSLSLLYDIFPGRCYIIGSNWSFPVSSKQHGCKSFRDMLPYVAWHLIHRPSEPFRIQWNQNHWNESCKKPEAIRALQRAPALIKQNVQMVHFALFEDSSESWTVKKQFLYTRITGSHGLTHNAA